MAKPNHGFIVTEPLKRPTFSEVCVCMNDSWEAVKEHDSVLQDGHDNS